VGDEECEGFISFGENIFLKTFTWNNPPPPKKKKKKSERIRLEWILGTHFEDGRFMERAGCYF
jgi:hypothetical protein